MNFYKFHLGENATEDEIIEYVKNQVIPKADNQFDRNVRQGDWGEILSGLIASYYNGNSIKIKQFLEQIYLLLIKEMLLKTYTITKLRQG